ncbi:hypothetical protein FUAX_43700 (plasmid) [Fulvitalea axinellae]|uniref:RagB/SusD domain-containing protein n=2 Tax=Fulvitalea axinellae TaxID=1182444 RepID=A0AAU9CNQ9_9BACT|nr:hypothetical protein FUAX_43700 [Fulvitalea axinellae]
MKTSNNLNSGLRGLFTALLCVSMFSCSDFFNPEQDLIQEKDEHYNSLDKVRRATVGAYAGLQPLVESLIVMGDLRADLLVTTQNYDADLLEIDKHEISANNPYASPDPFYDVILDCNDILANLEKSAVDPKMTELKIEAYEAEIRTIRAWVYLQLAQTFKEVPMVKESLDGHFPGYEPRVYDFSTMLNWLVKELEWANEKSRLDWTALDENPVWKKVYINRKALLGELYLLTGNFNASVDVLKDCILNDGNDADEDVLKCAPVSGTSAWKRSWFKIKDGVSGFEHLSVIPFAKDQRQTNRLMNLFSNDKIHRYVLKPSRVAVAKWEAQELKDGSGILEGDLYRGQLASYAVMDKDTIVYKYQVGKSVNQNDAVHTIYRAADLHLLLAEALNQSGQSEDALKVINEKTVGVKESVGIRGRVGLKPVRMVDLKDQNPALASDEKALVELALLEERAMEFAFEGRRWNTLVRFADRAGAPLILAERVASKYKQNDPQLYARLKEKLSSQDNWKLVMPELKKD